MKNYFQSRLKIVQLTLSNDEAVFITPSVEIYYFTGFTGDDSSVFLTSNKVYFITDSRYTEQIRIEKKIELEVTESNSNRKIGDIVAELCAGQGIKKLWISEKSISLEIYENLKEKVDKLAVQIENTERIKEMRLVKDELEIEILRQNIMLTELGYQAILPFVKEGKKETEIAAELEYYLRKRGSRKPSFETIVASGNRSTLPHGVASEKFIQKEEIVMFDFGIFKDGYCSDFTRCYYFGKIISPKIQEIHGIVLEALKNAESMVKPGIPVSSVHQAAYDTIQRSGYEKNFWHSTGHGVGLEIHEAPRVGFGDDTILREGMVFTVEPGIYLPGLGGVRLEDMVVVRKGGFEVLTTTSYDL